MVPRTSCAFTCDWNMRISTVTQGAFIDGLVERFGFTSASGIPAQSSVELGLRKSGEIIGDWPYREAVAVMLGKIAVRWLSSAQKCTMVSTTEAE